MFTFKNNSLFNSISRHMHKNDDPKTRFHAALPRNDLITLRDILNNHPEQFTLDDNFPMLLAAGAGALKSVKFLHKNNVELTMESAICAGQEKHNDVVQYFLDNGLNHDEYTTELTVYTAQESDLNKKKQQSIKRK